MNTLKIQQEVLKDLCTNGNTRFFATEDDSIFLTVTGKVGYFVPAEQLQVQLRNAQSMLPLNLAGVVVPDFLLVGTDEYRIGGGVRKYRRCDGEDTYIATGLLKLFDNPTLYQDPFDESTVVVTEDLFGTGEQTVVGVVAPYRMKEEN